MLTSSTFIASIPTLPSSITTGHDLWCPDHTPSLRSPLTTLCLKTISKVHYDRDQPGKYSHKSRQMANLWNPIPQATAQGGGPHRNTTMAPATYTAQRQMQILELHCLLVAQVPIYFLLRPDTTTSQPQLMLPTASASLRTPDQITLLLRTGMFESFRETRQLDKNACQRRRIRQT